MRKSFEFLFRLSCVLFLLSGSLLVIGQIIGLLIQNGNLIILSADIFGTPTFLISGIAGLCGFVLNYIPPSKPVENVVPTTQPLENS